MGDQSNNRSLDDFWDISDLIPKRKQTISYHRPAEPVEIHAPSIAPKREEPADTDTVIVRYIHPSSEETLTGRTELYESEESYAPTASLIHEVTLKKKKSSYRFYQDFLEDALRLSKKKGSPCDYVPYFSYVPQYNQLNEQQLAYYLWFRDSFLRGERIRIDYSYVLLWVYERINLGASADVLESQRILTKLWYAYEREFPALSSKLAEWICDFSLIHRLPPPPEADEQLVRRVPTLREFYLTMPDYDIGGCVKSLLKFCSSYNYQTSKFATEENLPLFERHVPEALKRAVSFYSSDGKILSDLSFEDSTLKRDAYAGALCTSDARIRIEVRYCSFSRSNELRFLVGDVIKYAENKIRVYLGIKSKMTVYSIPTELQRILDEYFVANLSGRKIKVSKREPEAYEALYEISKVPLSLSAAERIERESWSTTEKLVSAFEAESEISETVQEKPRELISEPSEFYENGEGSELSVRLKREWKAICA
ncbi:MAG: TerB N-terminal domain-containing protein, partial [Clostridia bacterium]|nr:TerB N-terminal domain-containing protein [Clostridia bacterium]